MSAWRERVEIAGGRAVLYLGDSLDIIPTLQHGCARLCITDPPFMWAMASAQGKLNPWADLMNGARWFADWYRMMKGKLPPDGAMWTCLNWRSVATVQKASCDIDWPIASMLVWDKAWIGPGGTVGLRPSYEMVALIPQPAFALPDRGLPDVQRFNWSAHKPHGHPAEKPETLISWLMTISGPGAVIDPFMGSGTTGAVAMKQGRSYIGIETDEAWFECAMRRIEGALSQGEMFPPAEPVSDPYQSNGQQILDGSAARQPGLLIPETTT